MPLNLTFSSIFVNQFLLRTFILLHLPRLQLNPFTTWLATPRGCSFAFPLSRSKTSYEAGTPSRAKARMISSHIKYPTHHTSHTKCLHGRLLYSPFLSNPADQQGVMPATSMHEAAALFICKISSTFRAWIPILVQVIHSTLLPSIHSCFAKRMSMGCECQETSTASVLACQDSMFNVRQDYNPRAVDEKTLSGYTRSL
ncbi:hypothetical protein CPC08DRAFT_454464 [Agrocybe pediades]|nr:hypothetical protein CPC08DRAFT_454464 [Agrocybe pediades]